MNSAKPQVNVEFDQTSAVFRVGEEAIKGNVKISLTRLMKTQMINIEFKGVCEYNWKKRDFSKKKQKYRSDQHFNIKDILLTPRSEYNDLFLAPGAHNFPFVFELPDSLPATFTADDGRIEYFARVVVLYRDEGSMEVNEIRTEVPFVIKKHIASFPAKLLQSREIKKQLTLSKLFSRSTLICVSSKLPKSIYYRGEMVRLQCDYSVLNGGKVSGVYAVLIQKVHVVKPNGDEITKSREVVRAPPFHGTEGSSKWSDIYIEIPSSVSLTVQKCGRITISYYIQIGAPKSKENLVIPIVIIDRDVIQKPELAKPRTRRFSLTGSQTQLPNVFQSFNTFDRKDPARLSISSIDSHRLYYSQD